MSLWVLLLILVLIGVNAVGFIWLTTRGGGQAQEQHPKDVHGAVEAVSDQAELDVEHIFNDEFREELRNRGRLHFEKIIGENAMFLQQDLRLTTSELNEFMKNEITKKLQEEFTKYEQSITDAKQMALDSINKTQAAIEEQRNLMSKQLQQEIANERSRMVKQFEENMADIVNHYVLAAIGNQIDLNDQLEYILSDLEANKEAIIKDIGNGA